VVGYAAGQRRKGGAVGAFCAGTTPFVCRAVAEPVADSVRGIPYGDDDLFRVPVYCPDGRDACYQCPDGSLTIHPTCFT
jgi:hypothetical protein